VRAGADRALPRRLADGDVVDDDVEGLPAALGDDEAPGLRERLKLAKDEDSLASRDVDAALERREAFLVDANDVRARADTERRRRRIFAARRASTTIDAPGSAQRSRARRRRAEALDLRLANCRSAGARSLNSRRSASYISSASSKRLSRRKHTAAFFVADRVGKSARERRNPRARRSTRAIEVPDAAVEGCFCFVLLRFVIGRRREREQKTAARTAAVFASMVN